MGKGQQYDYYCYNSLPSCQDLRENKLSHKAGHNLGAICRSESRTNTDKCCTGWWSNGSQGDEVGGELTWCSCLTKKIRYFKDLFSATRFKMVGNICTANALSPTLGEHQKVLNLIAVNSFKMDIRSQRSSIVYFSTKIRTDTCRNCNMNHVFLPLWGQAQQ